MCEHTAQIGRLSCTFVCDIVRFLVMWHSCNIGFVLLGDFHFKDFKMILSKKMYRSFLY